MRAAVRAFAFKAALAFDVFLHREEKRAQRGSKVGKAAYTSQTQGCRTRGSGRIGEIGVRRADRDIHAYSVHHRCTNLESYALAPPSSSSPLRVPPTPPSPRLVSSAKRLQSSYSMYENRTSVIHNNKSGDLLNGWAWDD